MNDLSWGFFFLYISTKWSLQVTGLQTQLKEQTDRCDSLSEQLSITASQSEERAASIDSLRQEVDHLKLVKVVLISGSSPAAQGLWQVIDRLCDRFRRSHAATVSSYPA